MPIMNGKVHHNSWGVVMLPWKYVGDVSRQLRQILNSMINVDPLHRATVNEALMHPWFLLEENGGS